MQITRLVSVDVGSSTDGGDDDDDATRDASLDADEEVEDVRICH